MSLTPNAISSILPSEFKLTSSTQIASLWSCYGYIYRLHVSSSSNNPESNCPNTLILKSIHPPLPTQDDFTSISESESNIRKLLSYAVERWFYAHLSQHLPQTTKIAQNYHLRADSEHTLLLEDLSVEFPFSARGSLSKEGAECVMRWLGGFHGCFYRLHRPTSTSKEGESVPVPLVPPPMEWTKMRQLSKRKHVEGVWRSGTYWYLDTRREELEETLGNEEEYGWLIPWIEKVDNAIKREASTYGTLLHGDVKGANIVFNRDPYRSNSRSQNTEAETLELQCALYDLQYTGIGLPTHDLVYFLGTSVQSSLLKTIEVEQALLKVWLDAFTRTRSIGGERVDREDGECDYDFVTLWRHWELSILDWYRFMAGWGFWGNDRWVERRAREIVGSGRVERLVNFGGTSSS